MRTDLAGTETGAALDLLDAATDRLCEVAARLGDEGVHQPSALEGWTRGHVLAHVAYGASASARMTQAAAAGKPSAFYPGGGEQREASIARGARLSAGALVDELRSGAAELSAAWRALAPRAWDLPLRADAFPGATVARLLVLRLTEVELHTVDLRAGVDRWHEQFAPLALPLRLAWLPTHHRARPDADRAVSGRWSFHAGGKAWLVTAEGDRCDVAEVAEVADAAAAGDAGFAGTEAELLAFLLGRATADDLEVTGDRSLAAAFKAAFPGP